MSPEEQKLYDSIVHGLRSQGWSRIEAEGEALDRIERQRQKFVQDFGCDQLLAGEIA
jgi:hypothetical protein